jgi:hypothetical protein
LGNAEYLANIGLFLQQVSKRNRKFVAGGQMHTAKNKRSLWLRTHVLRIGIHDLFPYPFTELLYVLIRKSLSGASLQKVLEKSENPVLTATIDSIELYLDIIRDYSQRYHKKLKLVTVAMIPTACLILCG